MLRNVTSQDPYGYKIQQRLMGYQKATSLDYSWLGNQQSSSDNKPAILNTKATSLQQFYSFPIVVSSFSTSTPKETATQSKVEKLCVPPLNTTRILPTRHRTKNMILSILDDGSVLIELIKFNSKLKEDRVTEICKISGNYHCNYSET